MTCLDEHRKELATLSDVLSRADANVVARAVQAAEALTPSSDCDASTSMTRGTATTVPSEKERRAEALRAELGPIRVLDAAGRISEGLERSRVAVKEAEELGDAQVHAHALLVLGEFQIHGGDFDAAERTLRRAAALADAAADDEIRLRAWSRLLWVVGYASANHDAVPSLRETASAILTRLHDSDRDAVLYYSALSAALGAAGDGPGAIAADEHVVTLYEKLGLQNTRTFAVALKNAAANHLLEGEARYPEVLAAAERSLALFEETGGADDPAVASIHATIGFVLSADLRFSEAERAFRRGAHVIEAAGGGVHLAPYLDYIGMVRGEQGDFEGALASFRRALALREKALRPDHPDLLVPLAGVGQCLVALNRPREAVPFLQRALRLPATSADLDLAPADAQFELARALDASPRERTRARGLAEKALATFEAHAKNPLERRRRDVMRAWIVQRGQRRGDGRS
jgi:tetratricopeptide (TPR) repeat protein